MTAEFLKFSLYTAIFCLALLGVFYLRSRRLSWQGYLFWGTLAVFIPILGPFIVILSRPGEIR